VSSWKPAAGSWELYVGSASVPLVEAVLSSKHLLNTCVPSIMLGLKEERPELYVLPSKGVVG
jgi:hypothetical protein